MKKLDTAADMALDEAAEAAKFTLADRLVKEAATCDMKTLAHTLEVADQLRSRRRHAETEAVRHQALDLLGDKIPMLLDAFIAMVAGAPPMGAPRPQA
jgi:hypothetical protein